MKRIFHKASAILVWTALCLVMLTAVPVAAVETDLTVRVSETEVLAEEDGSFTFAIELGSDTPYLGCDVYVRCEEGVALSKVTVDNGRASVSQPTPGKTAATEGLVGFGFFVSGDAIESSTLTVTGKCDAEGGTVTIVRVKVYTEALETLTDESGTVIRLRKQAAASETTAPVTLPTTPEVSETTAPVTLPATPETSETTAPDTGSASPTTSDEKETTTTGEPIGVSTDKPNNGSNDGSSDQPTVPPTGDMNVPMLQISCAVIAVIAASALIYITHKQKIRKGE